MDIKKIFLWGIFSWLAAFSLQAIDVTSITCEMMRNPLALDVDCPRFGWQLRGAQGCMQSAYQIEVYIYDHKGRKVCVWESGKIVSDRSQLVPYGGNPLEPMTRYFWRVKVWDERDHASSWSKEAEFRLAPDSSLGGAAWIGAITNADARFPAGRKFHGNALKVSKDEWDAVDSLAWRSICLRKEFVIKRDVREATIYICGLGHYELTLNGRKVGDGEFTPLISDYDKTVYYNTYDVTSYLKSGANAAGVLLGNGFYNVVGGGRYRKLQIGFGAPVLKCMLVINYTDGTVETVKSGDDWIYSLSPITFNSIYGGEDYDARMEQPGWNQPGFIGKGWHNVVLQEGPKGVLRPQQALPVKVMERFDVQAVHKLTDQEVLSACKSTKRIVDATAVMLDMGQNLAGFPEITVKGKRGQKITILMAESLTPENAVNQRQTGRQHYYTYTLKGGGTEVWHPRFSYYGFRYIQIEGAVMKGEKNISGLPVIEKVQSCFVYNSASAIGSFECSNKIFSQAYHLIDRAVRSNMQGVFTDCPHREKLGWLEQVHLVGPGLFYNYDLSQYAPKVMRDIVDSQRPDGMIPTIAPQYVIFEGPGMDVFADSPEWSTAVIMLPFMYYETYGDDSLIKRYYPNMRRYVDYLTSRAVDHIIDFGLGDWYDYKEGYKGGFTRNTSRAIVGTAHYYMDICRLAQAAELLGNEYDVRYYKDLAESVKQKFNMRFFHKDSNQYDTGSQCANSLALFLGLVPDEHRQAVLENLVKDIEKHGYRLTTGDVGNRYLFQTLARNGLNEVMYRMHNHEDVPGYGFQLKFGATTLTEQWDPRQGSSWNHFMMGQIMEWFYNSLAGIKYRPDGYGGRHLDISPQPVGDLTYVKASYRTLYGEVKVEWKVKGRLFTLDLDIPVNCTASVGLPGQAEVRTVKSGNHTFSITLD